jgi:hypothetical protein
VVIGCADPGDHSVVVVLRPLTAKRRKTGSAVTQRSLFFVWFAAPEPALFD